MSLWPSRGLEMHGFEVKVSRSDWIKELRTPDKAEAVYRYCDHWWIVAGGVDIVAPGELPPTWGMIVADKGKLVVRVAAPKLEPVGYTADFLAAVLRRAVGITPEAELRTAYERGVGDGMKRESERNEKREESDLRYLRREHDQLQKQVREFEAASGVRIDRYGSENANIGDAVRRVLEGEDGKATQRLLSIRTVAHNIAQEIDQLVGDARVARDGAEVRADLKARAAG